MFNAYGAATDWIAQAIPDLLRDAVAAMIEANRTAYRDKAKVVPAIMEATQKPKEAVEYAIDILTKHCVWSVNEGFNPKRTQWTIDYDVSVGDIEAAKKPTRRAGRRSQARRAPPSRPPAAASPSATAPSEGDAHA